MLRIKWTLDSRVTLDYRDPGTVEIILPAIHPSEAGGKMILQLRKSEVEQLLKGFDQ